MFSIVQNIYYIDKLHVLFGLTEKLTLEAGLSTTSSTRLKHACINVPFDALNLRMGVSPTPAGTGKTKHSRAKTLYSWKHQEGEAFPADAQTVLGHKSSWCGKESRKEVQRWASHSGTESSNEPQLSFPSWFRLGTASHLMFLYLSAAICLFTWKSHQGEHSVLPGTLHGTARDSSASRT